MEEDKTTHNPDDKKGTLNEIFGLWRGREIDIDKLRQEQWGRFAGVLSNETAEALLKYVAESRNEWEERIETVFRSIAEEKRVKG